MREPHFYSADEIKIWNVQCQGKNGLWTQARPEALHSIAVLKRLEAAWKVFTGKADVLVWFD